MTTTHATCRAAVLSGLVILSVVAGSVAIGGTVSASHGQTTRGGEPWSTDQPAAAGAVGDGAVLFQGEQGIEAIEAGNGSAADFRHVDSNVSLQVPIPESQPTGTYRARSNGDELTVRTPQITHPTVLTSDGTDLTGSTVTQGETVDVTARYNFGTASDLAVTVVDEDGLEVTQEAIPSAADRVAGTTDPTEAVSFPVQTDGLDPGTYTISLEGRSPGLAWGEADVATTLTVGSQTPRITDYDVRLGNGADVTGGTVPPDEETLRVRARYTFGEDSDLTVSVHDESATEVTDDAIPDQADQVAGTTDSTEYVSFPVDVGRLAPGEYTVTITAEDVDMRGGEATVQDTFTVESTGTLDLAFHETTFVRHGNAGFEIHNGREGEYHVVTLDRADVASGSDPVDALRIYGSTVAIGTTESYVYGLVEIEGGTGAGLVDVEHLRPGNVTVDLHGPVEANGQDRPISGDEQIETYGVQDETELWISETGTPPDSDIYVYSVVQSDGVVEFGGRTTHEQGEATLTVEVIDGPTPEAFETRTLEVWDDEGEWTVSMEPADPERGRYTVRVSDGTTSSIIEFPLGDQIVDHEPETATPTAVPSTTDPRTATPTTQTTTATTQTADSTETGTATATPTATGTATATATPTATGTATATATPNQTTAVPPTPTSDGEDSSESAFEVWVRLRFGELFVLGATP